MEQAVLAGGRFGGVFLQVNFLKLLSAWFAYLWYY